MKSSYTFRASPKDTDYQRICRENPNARFIVVKSEGMAPLTFVRCYYHEHETLRRLGHHPTGRIDVPPEGRPGRTWLIFEGDFSKELAPEVQTTVEVH